MQLFIKALVPLFFPPLLVSFSGYGISTHEAMCHKQSAELTPSLFSIHALHRPISDGVLGGGE